VENAGKDSRQSPGARQDSQATTGCYLPAHADMPRYSWKNLLPAAQGSTS